MRSPSAAVDYFKETGVGSCSRVQEFAERGLFKGNLESSAELLLPWVKVGAPTLVGPQEFAGGLSLQNLSPSDLFINPRDSCAGVSHQTCKMALSPGGPR